MQTFTLVHISLLLTGRFDLNATKIACKECAYEKFCSEIDYIESGWWPGLAVNSTYLFSFEVLDMWYHLNHQNNGLSQRKFVATLSKISQKYGRVRIY